MVEIDKAREVLELVTKIDGDSAVEKFEVMPFSVESTESERIATESARGGREGQMLFLRVIHFNRSCRY